MTTPPHNEVNPKVSAMVEQLGQLMARARRAENVGDLAALVIAMQAIHDDLEQYGVLNDNKTVKPPYIEYYNKGLAEG